MLHLVTDAAIPAPWGTYTPVFLTDCDTRWLPDGRSMMLLADFRSRDSRGVEWCAPRGAIINGFSIPKPLQWLPLIGPLIGSPLEGKGREGSVTHDVYCFYGTGQNPFCNRHERNCFHNMPEDFKPDVRPHADVHHAFYEFCQVGGMAWLKARLYYRGVRVGGPKWGGGK